MAFKYQAAAEDQGLNIVSLVLKTLENWIILWMSGIQEMNYGYLLDIQEYDNNF